MTLDPIPADRGAKRLSFILGARNDRFAGNFQWRIETALNYLLGNLRALGRLEEVEVVVADWGSAAEPLHRALALSPLAGGVVRFVVVPPDLARRLQRDSEFPVVLAQNAAVRRSRGEWIAQMDSDVLLPTPLLEGIFDFLDRKRAFGLDPARSLLITKRRHIPYDFVAACPGLEDLDWFVRRVGRLLPVETAAHSPFWAAGMMLMHRRMWEECRGYDERLIYRGMMEIDLGRRVAGRYAWADLAEKGLTAFHLEHHPRRFMADRKWNSSDWESGALCPNAPGWGLGEHVLSESACSAPPAEGDGRPRGSRGGFRACSAEADGSAAKAGPGRPLWRATRGAAVMYLRRRCGLFRWAAYQKDAMRIRIGILAGGLRGQPLRRWPEALRRLASERARRRKGAA